MEHSPARQHGHPLDQQPGHDHQRSGRHDRHRDQQDSDDQHRVLDLDAEVFGAQLEAVLDLAGVAGARNIFDLGAGTGVGSRLLHERYPDATVICIDNDPRMLERLRLQGFRVVGADLDDGFPTLTGPETDGAAASAVSIDLVWASSSLHHVSRPGRLLSGIREALAPDGVLLVVELAALPLFLVDPDAAALEQRCHAAAAAEGWNQHPDWAPMIQAAGFEVSTHELTTVAPVSHEAREYARQWLMRFAHLESLSSEDRVSVQALADHSPADLELTPRATRTVWVATPTELE